MGLSPLVCGSNVHHGSWPTKSGGMRGSSTNAKSGHAQGRDRRALPGGTIRPAIRLMFRQGPCQGVLGSTVGRLAARMWPYFWAKTRPTLESSRTTAMQSTAVEDDDCE